MNAPIAPIAPEARLSTPVARESTTSPTPDREYTPPRPRPATMKGWKSCQLGTALLLALEGPHLLDRGVDVGDLEAVLELDHLAVLGRRRPVGVVRDVQRPVAVVPGLAEDVGLEVLDVLERRVDALGRKVAVDRHQRLRRDAGLDEAHLREAAERDLRRVLLQHRAVEL